MRVVGTRKERTIEFFATGELLEAGARYNDQMNTMFGPQVTPIARGVYRFKTHEEANRQADEARAKRMAAIAASREREFGSAINAAAEPSPTEPKAAKGLLRRLFKR